MKIDWNSREISIDNLIRCLSRREKIKINSLPDIEEYTIYELKIDNEQEIIEIIIESCTGERHKQIFSIC